MRPAWNLAAIALLALAVAACADDAPAEPAAVTPTTTAAPARPTAAVDELVDVGGARLQLRCEGAGPETVLLLPGFGGDATSWDPVFAAVADETRACTYARFGTGRSDAAPVVQTFRTEADDLRTLLEAAGEPGPYVVAGHSFGGIEAVAFTAASDDVEALLLLDTSPVDWPDAACATDTDVFRQTCASIVDPAANPERLDGRVAFAEAAGITSLGDLPLTVLARATPDFADADAAQTASLRRTFADGQARWASLSSHGELVGVEGTSHYIQNERPELVTEHLLRLLPPR